MSRKPLLHLLVYVFLLSTPAVALADGDIYVGGPYGTKITSVPYSIDSPGCYYLTSNLTYSLGYGSAIYVNSDDVTLDLNGFSLTGPAGSYGITWGQHKNIEVRNGTITGFYIGVWGNDSIDGGGHHRIISLRAEGNTYGVWMNGDDILINGCTATQGSFGSGSGLTIYTGTGVISDCRVENFGGHGVYIGGGKVSGNAVKNCQYGIFAVGPALISKNQVLNCNTGINCAAASIIANTAATSASNQTGIAVSDAVNNPALFDQNTVTGPGTHYTWGAGTVQWRNNAGYP